MPLAPFVHRWRLLAAVLLLAAAVATPVFAQGERQNVMYILMGDNYFLPASVTIRAPSTVVWINQGSTIHSVRSGMWDSGPMVPGQAFWRIFNTPGEYWFTDPSYTDDGMSGYVTVQVNPIPATRTPEGGPRITQPQPGQAPREPGPPTAQPSPGAITSPAPAVSPGPEAQTPAALASPVPGTPTTGVTGPPATGPGGAPPAGATPSGATPAPAASPRALVPPTGPSTDASSRPAMDTGSLPPPEGLSLPADDGVGFPMPLLGGGLVILGLVSGRWLRRP